MTDLKNLFAALVAFQSEVPALHRGSKNPHFGSTYASLDTTVKTVTPILCKHGLVWTALPGVDENGAPVLNYRLAHAPSGESLEGAMPLIIEKGNAQGFGSALTYARRYALTAVLNLVDEEDDDGNRAAAAPPAQRTRSSHSGGQGAASEKQVAFMRALFKKHHLTFAEVAAELTDAGMTVPPGLEGVTAAVEAITAANASKVIEKLKDRPVDETRRGGKSDPQATEVVTPEMFDVPPTTPPLDYGGENA